MSLLVILDEASGFAESRDQPCRRFFRQRVEMLDTAEQPWAELTDGRGIPPRFLHAESPVSPDLAAS
jgi:hypothetical protein